MILVAPTAFKGTHSAAAVTAAIMRAVQPIDHNAVALPVSDGGPGLLDALQAAQGGTLMFVNVSGPSGDAVAARVLVQSGRAVIESADACGLHLVPAGRRNPLSASTYGVGELLLAAARRAASIVVGLGGSATIDGGLGMAQALGYRLLDERGDAVARTGRSVLQLARIAGRGERLPPIVALADVHNPLFGPAGAARIFGPQKGATPEQVEELDAGLANVAAIMTRDLGVDVVAMTGAGAAGGLGAGLRAFAGADVQMGSAWVLQELGLAARLRSANLLITGEGAYDAQSAMGKITGVLIERAGAAGVPVLLVTGSVEGSVPAHVRVLQQDRLELSDIEQLVRVALPRLLRQ